MAEGKTFRCNVMTGQETVLQTEASSVVLPARDGLIGILANHAPLAVALGKGTLTIRQSGQTSEFAVSGGLAHMANNVLSIIAEVCLPKK